MENGNIKLMTNAMKALVIADKQSVLSLLKKYNYKASRSSPNVTLQKKLIDGMSKSSEFTSNVIVLLKKNSTHKAYSNAASDYFPRGESSNTTSNIISSALSGLGMVTSTWKETALIKAGATKYSADVSRKLSPTAIIGIIAAGLTVLTIGAVVVVKTAK